jgi:pSer/pThr/pTyr-binding forkhead associated (FHA) protein
MSNAALKQGKSVFLRMTIDSGDQKGRSFVTQGNRVSIGRDDENDIVISSDIKMSRKHAEIVLINGAYLIRNLSQKNSMLIDGQEAKEHLIERKFKLQIGDSIFVMDPDAKPKLAMATSPNSTMTSNSGSAVPPPSNAPRNGGPFSQPAAVRTPPIDAKKMNFYIAIGIIGLAFVWLLSGESIEKKKPTELRTRDQVLMDLEKSEEAIRNIEKKQVDAGRQSLQYKTAQEHYIKGFRDYRQGQYARAISSFQAALSFYPQHELSRKYLILSRRKFDEIVQFNMIQGKRYKGKNNYRLCKSAYANVMIMLKDPNDAIYREAKQFYNECSLLLEGKF